MAASGGGGGGSAAIRAGRAFVEVLWEDSALKRGLARSQAMVRNAGQLIGRAGLAIAGGALAAGGALGGLFAAAVGRDEHIYRLSQRLGVAADKLSAFEYAAGTTGQTIDDLGGHWENLAERILQAQAGSGEAFEAFKSIGVDPKKFAAIGDPVEHLIELSRAMAGITDDTKRRGILSGFGGDQFQGLNELFKLGPDRIRELMATAGKLGATVSNENAELANQISGLWGDAKAALGGVLRSIGEALFPQVGNVQSLRNGFVEVAGAVRGWIGENREAVAGVAAGLAVAAAIGAAFVAVGLGLSAVAAAAGGFGAALAVVKGIAVGLASILLSPFVALPAAIAVAIAAWMAFTESGRAAFQELVDVVAFMFGDTVENFRASWKDIVAAISRGDFEAAFRIGLATIEVEWIRFVNFLKRSWDDFANSHVGQSLAKIGERVAKLFGDEGMVGLKLAPGVNAQFEDEGARRLREAQGRLDEERARSRAADEESKRAAKKLPGAKGDAPAVSLAQVQSQIRGAFAGSAGQGVFQSGMAGLEKVAKDQLKAQQEMRTLLGLLNEGIRGLEGPAFAGGSS